MAGWYVFSGTRIGVYGLPGLDATSTRYCTAVGILKTPISHVKPPKGWSPTPAPGLGGGTWPVGSHLVLDTLPLPPQTLLGSSQEPRQLLRFHEVPGLRHC